MPPSAPQWLWNESVQEYCFWSEVKQCYLSESGLVVRQDQGETSTIVSDQNLIPNHAWDEARPDSSQLWEISYKHSEHQAHVLNAPGASTPAPNSTQCIAAYHNLTYPHAQHIRHQAGAINPSSSQVAGYISHQELRRTPSKSVTASMTDLQPSHSGLYERLDPAFKVQRPASEFFRIGKLFKILWPEPAGSASTTTTKHTTYFQGNIFVSVRWFVVVREDQLSSVCVPVQTYRGHGVTQRGLKKENHAIAYTGKLPPKCLPGEEPAGVRPGLRSPIRFRSRSATDKLDARTRINFAKVYTIEHNVKTYDFGDVDEEFIWTFRDHFHTVWQIPLPDLGTTIHQDYNAEQEDPYRSIALLGQGSYGFVDKVEARLQNNSVFARKLFRLPSHPSRREKMVEETKKEARITHSLRHHHIVAVHESYHWRQYFGIIMRPVAQGDLASFLDQVDNSDPLARLPMLQSVPGWCACLIQALLFVHNRLVRHKDIKPSNILIDNGAVLLTDFGLAEDMAGQESTGTEGSIGPHTARYCAPEVVLDSARRGRSADVFSLGCVFLELATVSICSTRARAQLLDYQLEKSQLSTSYSSRPTSIANWILYLWTRSVKISHVRKSQNRYANFDGSSDSGLQGSSTSSTMPITWSSEYCAYCGDLVADFAFLMMDPDPTERVTAQQLLTMMREDQSNYSRTIQAAACDMCRNVKDLEYSRTKSLPLLKPKSKIVEQWHFDNSDAILRTGAVKHWATAKRTWLESTALSVGVD